MGLLPLGQKGRPLGDAEAVLLVGNDQAQIGKDRGLGQKGVGADDQVKFPVRQLLPQFLLFCGAQGAGQQGAADAKRRKQRGKTVIMLLCQNFRRGHQGRLPTVFCRAVGRRSRHHGLAAAYIALDQTAHGPARAEIRQNLLHGAALGTSQGEGQGIVKGIHMARVHGRVGVDRPLCPKQGKGGGENIEFFKGEPFQRRLQSLGGGGHMDLPEGAGRVAQAVGLPDGLRQRLRHAAARHGRLNCRKDLLIGQTGGQRIDGHDAAGHRP